jgi:thiol-disulfide isomerase/thioredoxin
LSRSLWRKEKIVMCPHRTPRSLVLLLLTALATGLTPHRANAADQKSPFILDLIDGSQIPGELSGSRNGRDLRWRSRYFTEPLDFPQSALKSVRYDQVGPPPAPTGEFCFELISNDFIYGDLRELTDKELVVASARLGSVRFSRDFVRRIYRYKGADAIYLGPNGLLGWKDRSNSPQWLDDGGQLQTSRTGASIYANLNLPALARIEVELSWQQKPDFALGLGVNESETASRGFHFEVWDKDLVAVAESARDADVASLQKVEAGPGRVRIQAYLDQNQGRLVLLSSTGKILATLNTHPKKPQVFPGVRLTNGRGDVRLESIRVARWNGQLPKEARENQPRFHRTDGTIVYGQLTAYDGKRKQFTIRDGSTDTVVGQDVMSDMLLMPALNADGTHNSPVDTLYEDDAQVKELRTEIDRANEAMARFKTVSSSPEKLPEYQSIVTNISELKQKIALRKESLRATSMKSGSKPGVKADAVDGSIVRISLRDGQRLSGFLSKITDKHLTLSSAELKGPLPIPFTELRLLVVPRFNALESTARSSEGRAGRLEIEDMVVKGWLVPGKESGTTSCLAWHPDLSLNSSSIALGCAGHIVYVDSPQRAAAVPARQNRQQQIAFAPNGGMIQQVFIDGRGNDPYASKQPQQTLLPGGGKPALHLRTGDTIPCEVTNINEKGISLKTPIAETNFVPHEKIKSIELITTWGSNQIEEAKRDRLLTLPRLQRDSPPTHLICSKNGDFLRGRILSMDENELKVEVRLETRKIPRDRVAQIIWLHPDELSDKPVAQTAAKAGAKTRVQTIRPNGDRLTFVADKTDLKQISGRSDVLGPCHVELSEVDQVLFGSFIEESAALLAYQRWKLHHAQDPRYVLAEASGGAPGSSSGVESPLVGQPAYAFQLDMLDGTQFNLAARKGRILVLDFWATWCGPCMQTMPLVDEVVRSFADKQVDLVAVNMEEQPQAIKSMLERHKLKIPVALDRDGVIAAKYAVTAIPQTVVIDREGKVVRLFVGGGKNTVEALRKVLQELTDGKPAGEKSN